MSKIIVTGGAGFIGSHLADKLIEKGHDVVVIDNLSTGKKENLNPKADFHNLDIRNFDEIKDLFKDVDFVFHLAALARMPISVKDPVGTSEINIMGTINVFKAGIDAGVKRIIFASSSSVYGNQDKLPLIEDMVPNPISPYALQKFLTQLALMPCKN
ncbi:MAG: SDR family NAD(P)-dependent oxidoreductase [Candidatus Heimdallarchaeaceae archaeon]